MKPNEYLQRMNERRQELEGMPRVWADYNMMMEIIDVRPTLEIVTMAVADCHRIIADLEARPQTSDVLDALEVKRNQLNELEGMMK